MGGAIKAMEKGWIREQLEKELLREEREIKEKKRIIVGLNDFVIPKEEEVRIAVGRDRSLEDQMATSRVREELARKFREERDNATTKSALEDLSSEAEKGEKHNLIDAIKEALRADATMGEIIGTIREAYGATYDPLGHRGDYPFK
jgi:methylmalonyl-CoA mutase N-terminal domain/subunit